MTRIAIDPNVRVRGHLTYAGFEDVYGDLPLDGMVEVFEPEAGICGSASVVEVDTENSLIYLEVDWASMRPVISERPSMIFSIQKGFVEHMALTEASAPATKERIETETGLHTEAPRVLTTA